MFENIFNTIILFQQISLTFSTLLAFLCFLWVSGRFGAISCMKSRVQSGIDPRNFASDP